MMLVVLGMMLHWDMWFPAFEAVKLTIIYWVLK